MKIFGQPTIGASVAGDTWTFKVTYIADFTQEELNRDFTFGDQVRLREEDNGADDVVTNWSRETKWIPQARRETWIWTVNVHEDNVDTEWGGEEIYGQIALRNVSTLSAHEIGNSAIIQVSPD